MTPSARPGALRGVLGRALLTAPQEACCPFAALLAWAGPFPTWCPIREQPRPGTGWGAVGAYGPPCLVPTPESPTVPAPSTAGDTTSRPTANAMRLTPPLVRVVLVRYAAPAPGGSGGLFSSRRCLFAPVYVGARRKRVEAPGTA